MRSDQQEQALDARTERVNEKRGRPGGARLKQNQEGIQS